MIAPRLRRVVSAVAAAAAAALMLPSPSSAQAAGEGRLVIMGGGGFGSRPDVYRAILEARRGGGPVCVIPTASATPESSIESAVGAFVGNGGEGSAIGIPQLTVENLPAASDPAVVQTLGTCSGFYFVGGVQSRIVTLLRPEGRSTPAFEAIQRRFREGAVVSGSSAGAAIMSDPMIAGGASGAMAGGLRRASGPDAGDDAPTAEGAPQPVRLEPGLGFFPAALVDQHYLARGRFGRLLVAVTEMPEFDLGFGIDESTALVVEGGAVWPVGRSGVVVIDESRATRSGSSVTNVRLHLMSAGDRYDLATRSVTAASAKRPLPAGPAVTAPENLFARWAFFQLLDGFARSSQTELTVPVPTGRVVLRKGEGFAAYTGEGEGVEGTAPGLTITNLIVELHRQP